MSVPSLPHRIEYTKNRHSRAVLEGSTVVIRLARNLSRTEEAAHVQNLLGRMAKYWVRDQERTRIDPFRNILNGASEDTITLASGKTYVFRLSPGTTTRAKRTPDGWNVSVAKGVRRSAFHRYLWKLLSTAELSQVEEDVRTLNQRFFGARITQVKLRYTASQWGSCSAWGTIALNATLLFVPDELREYVIIHELAHRFHQNHSARFWNVVKDACPDYLKQRKKLRSYKICSL